MGTKTMLRQRAQKYNKLPKEIKVLGCKEFKKEVGKKIINERQKET